MRLILRYWYDIGLVIGLGLLAAMAIRPFDGLQLILLLNIAALMVHQFEEYHVPGGEPWILNEVFQPRGGPVDRFPLNQGNAAFINILAWPFYLIPALFPGVLWLGIGQVLFGMVGQLVIHGVITNIKLKTFYNPGLAAVIFGHVPLGIWYLVAAYDVGPVGLSNWIFGILYLLGFLVIFMIILGYRVMLTKDARWAFAPEEVDRFNRLARLRHAGITPLPFPLEDNPVARPLSASRGL
jgi:hypothetical protein